MDEKQIEDIIDARNPIDSAIIENQIQLEFNKNQTVTVINYPLNAKSIVLPAIENTRLKERKLNFMASDNPDKALLYRMVVAAYNYAYTNKYARLSVTDHSRAYLT